MTSKRQRYKTPRRLRGQTEDHECISRKALSFGLLCGEKRYYSCKEGSRKTDILRLFCNGLKQPIWNNGKSFKREDVDVNYPPPKGGGLLLNGSPD